MVLLQIMKMFLQLSSKDKSLVMLAVLPWLFISISSFSQDSFTFTTVFNYFTLIFFGLLFLSIRILANDTQKYPKISVLLLVSYLFPLIMMPLMIFISRIFGGFMYVLLHFFGVQLEIELSLLTSLVLTYVLFFRHKTLITRKISKLGKISLFGIINLFVFEAVLTTIQAFHWIDGWVDDAMRSTTLVVLMWCVLHLPFSKFLPRFIRRIDPNWVLVPVAVIISVSFGYFLLDINYNFSVQTSLENNQLVVKQLVTEEKFIKEVSEGKLKRIEEYEKIIGYPDASRDSYEYLRGGQLKKYYYCFGPTILENCRGYQLTVKDGYVTSTQPSWGPHEFNFMRSFLFENWLWNRFFGLLPYKDFS